MKFALVLYRLNKLEKDNRIEPVASAPEKQLTIINFIALDYP